MPSILDHYTAIASRTNMFKTLTYVVVEYIYSQIQL